jgi:hypothetical protein
MYVKTLGVRTVHQSTQTPCRSPEVVQAALCKGVGQGLAWRGAGRRSAEHPEKPLATRVGERVSGVGSLSLCPVQDADEPGLGANGIEPGILYQ